MNITIMRIREDTEGLIGKARIKQLISNTDSPITIIGFRPILSEREPKKGENNM